jgi:hypothetical protein
MFPVEDISDQGSVCSGEQRVYICEWFRDPAVDAVYSRFSGLPRWLLLTHSQVRVVYGALTLVLNCYIVTIQGFRGQL